ncbi:hypothetical protein [Lactiplantibacillus pentosus]|uniref:hypothetical protein n=1 Tax=Lactiplantibacillus pentosus TaxID=1589 RepID=UPI0028B41419|nr:hypothetical protein [Lactiplantibacillus pentosus]MDT7001232.1 hypothetical protein [Lactiplantibacillus pentosus]
MVNFERTEAQIAAMVAQKVIPGASYALIDGEQVIERQVGVASCNRRLSRFGHTPFMIWHR